MFILKRADILPLCAYENIYFENKHFFHKIKIDIYWNHTSFIIKGDFLKLFYFFSLKYWLNFIIFIDFY